jgi:hypothetical protein
MTAYDHPPRFDELVFEPHALALEMRAVGKVPLMIMPDLADLDSAVQALVEYGNGVSVSIISYRPSQRPFIHILKGDLNVPNYEVMISYPDKDSDMLNFAPPEDIETLLSSLFKYF